MKAETDLIPRGVDPTLAAAARLVLGVFPALVTLCPTASQEANARDQVLNTGQDFFKPPQNLFQLMYGYRTAPGSGSTPGSVATTTDTVKLRLDHRIDLPQQSMLALRSDLPLVAKNPITSSNPDGDYRYGVGDADA